MLQVGFHELKKEKKLNYQHKKFKRQHKNVNGKIL